MAGKPRYKQPTEDRLIKSALHYLERYATSAANLRKVLERKVLKACMSLELDPADYADLIDAVVEKCVQTGLVNDKTYAETKTAGLRRRGGSTRKSKLSWLPKALTEKRYTRCWHKTNAATRKPLGSSQDAGGLVHTEPHEREMTGATRIWLQCAGRAFPLKSLAR